VGAAVGDDDGVLHVARSSCGHRLVSGLGRIASSAVLPLPGGIQRQGRLSLSHEEVHMTLFNRRGLSVAGVVLLALVAGRAARGEDRPAAKAVDLLAGDDLTKHWTTTGNWKLDRDGVVTLQPRPGEKGWQRYDAYLWSKKEYKDFEAEFE